MNTDKYGFRAEFIRLLNWHSKENGSNTPDFILADYLIDCLNAWDKAVTRRTEAKEIPKLDSTVDVDYNDHC